MKLTKTNDVFRIFSFFFFLSSFFNVSQIYFYIKNVKKFKMFYIKNVKKFKMFLNCSSTLNCFWIFFFFFFVNKQKTIFVSY